MAIATFGSVLRTGGNTYETATLNDGRIAISLGGTGVGLYSPTGALLATVPSNQGAASVQLPQHVAALPDGGFVVSGGTGNSVVFRIYNADLSERTNGAVTVADPGFFNGGVNTSHAIKVLPNGGFALAWNTIVDNGTGNVGFINGSPSTLINPGSGTGIDVRGAIYTASGTPTTAPGFLITQGDISFPSYTIYSRFGDQYVYDLDALPSGDIVVTTYGQRFGTPSGGNITTTFSTPANYDSFRVINGTSGAAITGETPYNTTAAIGQERSSNYYGPDQTVILSNGLIAGLYNIDTEVAGPNRVLAKMQLFSPGGAPIGGRVDLALAFANGSYAPQITAIATDTGGFLLAYVQPAVTATLGDSNTYDVFVRQYAGDGTVISTQQITSGPGYDVINNLTRGPDGTYMLTSKAGPSPDTLTHRIVLTGAGDFASNGTTIAETLTAAGSNRNWIYSGGGADVILGGAGTNYLYGDTGDSTFFGGSGVTIVRGGTGNEIMYSGAQNDTLEGGEGNDILDGGAGADRMSGGTGNDQYLVDNLGDTVEEAANAGIDTVYVMTNGWTVAANVEIARLYGTASQVTGSSGADILVANAGVASTMAGEDGHDTLWGGGMLAHTLSGGAGDDIIRGLDSPATMIGGTGNDQFVIGNPGALIVENRDEGTDTAWVAVNGWTNFANVEIVRLAAPGAVLLYGSEGHEDLVANQGAASRLDGNGGDDTLWGSAFADTLNGGAGNDIMRGQGGADAMAGGAGNDQYVVFSSAAAVTELAGEGYDIVYFAGAGSFALGADIEEARLVELGTGLIGNAQVNLLVGNTSGLRSTIDGGGGNDVIYGTAAADTLKGGAGDDTLYSQGDADLFVYDAAGWGVDQIGGFTAGARLQFTAASGVTGFGQLNLNIAGGNTQVNHANGVILVFGAALSAGDFLFA